MIDIVVVTHGGFADGLMSSLEMVAGDSACCSALSLKEGDDPDAFRLKVKECIDGLRANPENDGVLVLVDLLGGTPSNCLTRVIREEGVEKVRCLTGLNFPMLVEAVFNRGNSDLADLERKCTDAAKQGVVSLAEMFSLS